MDEYVKRTDAEEAINDALKKVFVTLIGADIMRRVPAADVVPVVRCKDCKWWKLSDYNTMGIHICRRFSGVRGEHDFCSRGEADNGV